MMAIDEISVVVPFRNEAANLSDLLASFAVLDYPKELFEIIFVDDGSTDTTMAAIAAANQRNHLSRYLCLADSVRSGRRKCSL